MIPSFVARFSRSRIFWRGEGRSRSRRSTLKLLNWKMSQIPAIHRDLQERTFLSSQIRMGLDWMVYRKPKVGHEDELSVVMRRPDEILSDDEQRKIVEISDDVFTTMNAPRVGIDAEADEWLRNKLEQHNGKVKLDYEISLVTPSAGADNLKGSLELEPEDREYFDFDAARKQMQGFPVLELLPSCWGFPIPRYSSYGAFQGTERYTFRAKWLNTVSEELGDLHVKAWEDMTPLELVEYGEAILNVAQTYAHHHRIDWDEVAKLEEGALQKADAGYPEGELSPLSKVHLMMAAGNWCRFWGERGHPLHAWY